MVTNSKVLKSTFNMGSKSTMVLGSGIKTSIDTECHNGQWLSNVTSNNKNKEEIKRSGNIIK